MGLIITGKQNFAPLISANRLINMIIGPDEFFQFLVRGVHPDKIQKMLQRFYQMGGVKAVFAKLIGSVGRYFLQVVQAF